jgi:hypothetical protein
VQVGKKSIAEVVMVLTALPEVPSFPAKESVVIGLCETEGKLGLLGARAISMPLLRLVIS